MNLHYRLEWRSEHSLVLAIGFFDGLHRGHAAILQALRRLRRPGYRSGVLTFSNHPATYLRTAPPPLLSTVEERIDLLADAGIEECFFVPFDERIASLSPRDFVEGVLIGGLCVRGVVVGENFRFGKGRAGDVSFARSELQRRNVRFEAVANELDEGVRISSTRIRELIGQGKIAAADALLGHAFTLRGRVMLGAGRGRVLGFPTANLTVRPGKILPMDGVYSAIARHDGRDYAALVSIGTNPTFDGVTRNVEAWLRDFRRSIYGEELALRELRYVREQRRFSSAQELREQMELDADAVAYPSYG
ncbi:MAG: riboflavin biosynthesis protein RibF [Candidatus Eremiobacteraeota bacterium]|nr:riboflavin biosynthesis protein RibF [Candidatus Eremiobacteraeota bacterium]MBV9736568.1 riboflavin biosynthesis protein RibF [Candidatus Eremiobacteraeota bacterium]